MVCLIWPLASPVWLHSGCFYFIFCKNTLQCNKPHIFFFYCTVYTSPFWHIFLVWSYELQCSNQCIYNQNIVNAVIFCFQLPSNEHNWIQQANLYFILKYINQFIMCLHLFFTCAEVVDEAFRRQRFCQETLYYYSCSYCCYWLLYFLRYTDS